MESLQALAGVAHDLGRDAGVLVALDELPSLDPFLLREHMRRRGFEISDTHFEISAADMEKMQQFVGSEISRLIDLAYKGRSSNDSNTSRLVQALLSSRPDERLEPLRITLRLEGESYREGIFSWKGFLYYKWVLNSLWPKLREVLVELMKVKIVGPRDSESTVVADPRRMKASRPGTTISEAPGCARVSDFLRVYDQVYEELTKDGNATAFRDFLLKSPEMLVRLGEGSGIVSHIASFWRFRFPKGKPLEANVPAQLALDILAGTSRPASACPRRGAAAGRQTMAVAMVWASVRYGWAARGPRQDR